jgi:hypothetical protein
VRGDEVVTRAEVRIFQHGMNLAQRHIENQESEDDLAVGIWSMVYRRIRSASTSAGVRSPTR